MSKIVFLLLIVSFGAQAKLNVITTTSNLANLVELIAGEHAKVESLCRGVQDPHFLEAKPSYVFKLSKADLLISVGAGLEIGWLPLVIRGSRNPKLRAGQPRHLITANFIKLLEANPVNISRSQGDVHPEGNPHFMLSPLYSIRVAKRVRDKLIEIDEKNSSVYRANFMNFQLKMNEKRVKWSKAIKPGLKVVTYHRTLSYLYKEFNVENIDVLEPKPGIPPSASHIISLINKMKKQKVKKIIIENYFNDIVANRIKKEIPDVQIKIVPVGVNGQENINNLFEMYDFIVTALGS